MKKWLLALMLAGLALAPQLSLACHPFRNVLQDVNGNILAAGSVTVYKAGTSVAATLYIDSECTISTVNPTTSTPDGTFQFSVEDGYYDILFSFPGHTFNNLLAIPIFEPVLENMVPVNSFPGTDICAPVTGALAKIASQPKWLIINKAVTCGTTTSTPSTLTLSMVGNGSILETGGATLNTTAGTIVRPVKYLSLTAQLPSVTPDALYTTIVELAPPDNTAFAINAPLHPSQGAMLTYVIYNLSGAPIGAATWNAAYKMKAWTQPATGNFRAITFIFNTISWVEISRTEADVPY